MAVVSRVPGGARDEALDFVKGTLVVLMVLYHWLNKFIGVQWDGYRYIRFISPSFILMTGFLVSHVYLKRFPHDSPTLAWRLVRRGLKLVCLFVVLNLVAAVPYPVGSAAWAEWVDKMTSVAVFGEGKAAFTILLSIGYFLLISPLALLISTRLRAPLIAVAATAVALCWAASVAGRQTFHGEFLSIGLMGLAAGVGGDMQGYVERIGAAALATLYALYLAAVVTWNVVFPVQVMGVCVNVLVLYRLGPRLSMAGPLRWVVNLGKYSLFAYIAQIVVLQILRRGLPARDLSIATLGLTFAIALVATVASVYLMAYLRDRATIADRLYRTVFA